MRLRYLNHLLLFVFSLSLQIVEFNPLDLSFVMNTALASDSSEDKDNGKKAHASIMEYTGPETCINCHESEAQEIHGSVHYQQSGMTPNVTNITGTAGKAEGAFNTYCGSIKTSPYFTCAGCHVGNGLPPEPEMTTEQLNNIDCMMCHQDEYSRIGAPPYEDAIVVGADGLPTTIQIPVAETFRFIPDEAGMSISILEAARTVHPTTRASCLRCHAGASGSDGGKRGDISFVNVDPPITSDVHMSSQGEDLTCSDCHSAKNHLFKGRGLDLRPNDVKDLFTCAECHSDEPHEDYSDRSAKSLDRHATKVACQTCHIPKFAKDISTELVRDWTHSHFSETACGGRGGWLPEEVRDSDVTPTYRWFDGTSEVYNLGQIPGENADGEKAFGIPNGAVDSTGAKIYPMKEHRSVAAQHDATGLMIPHSTYTYFTQNSFDLAVRDGMEQEGMEGSYSLVAVHTYQTINHGVESEESALSCEECHGSGSRMDLEADLGYQLKASRQEICTQCHKNKKNEGFNKNHAKHVTDKGIDCSACHSFTRPERGLNSDIASYIDD
jgi:hypothetical protein